MLKARPRSLDGAYRINFSMAALVNLVAGPGVVAQHKHGRPGDAGLQQHDLKAPSQQYRHFGSFWQD
jgi:hypothetical protein